MNSCFVHTQKTKVYAAQKYKEHLQVARLHNSYLLYRYAYLRVCFMSSLCVADSLMQPASMLVFT